MSTSTYWYNDTYQVKGVSFPHVVDVVTDKSAGVTLKNLKIWLAEHRYVELEDFRHCGTKMRASHLLDPTINFKSMSKWAVSTGSWPAKPPYTRLGLIRLGLSIQYNRFRFNNKDVAIHFKMSW